MPLIVATKFCMQWPRAANTQRHYFLDELDSFLLNGQIIIPSYLNINSRLKLNDFIDSESR